MNWSETRQRLMKLAASRRLAVERGVRRGPLAPSAGTVPRRLGGEDRFVEHGTERRASSVCVASGKGGTGKSVVTASLASLFGPRGRTLVVDADMGVGNAHILQDSSPSRTLVDVVEGESEVADVVVRCRHGVDLIAAGSGVPRMAELSSYELHLVAAGLEEVEEDYAYLFVDSAAGVSRQTVAFAQACDVVVLVVTPDLTSMTDAYAFLKVLLARRPESEPLLIVNRASDDAEADEVAGRIERVSERFLGAAPRRLGWLPEDPVVRRCGNRRGPVVRLEPSAPISLALRRAAVSLQNDLARRETRGMGHRLRESVGYVPSRADRY